MAVKKILYTGPSGTRRETRGARFKMLTRFYETKRSLSKVLLLGTVYGGVLPAVVWYCRVWTPRTRYALVTVVVVRA